MAKHLFAFLALTLAACAQEVAAESEDDSQADSPPGGVPVKLAIDGDQVQVIEVGCDEFFSCDMTFSFDVDVGTQLRDAGLDPRFRVVRVDIYTLADDGSQELIKSYGVFHGGEVYTHHSDNADQQYRVELRIAPTAVKFITSAQVSGQIRWE